MNQRPICIWSWIFWLCPLNNGLHQLPFPLINEAHINVQCQQEFLYVETSKQRKECFTCYLQLTYSSFSHIGRYNHSNAGVLNDGCCKNKPTSSYTLLVLQIVFARISSSLTITVHHTGQWLHCKHKSYVHTCFNTSYKQALVCYVGIVLGIIGCKKNRE